MTYSVYRRGIGYYTAILGVAAATAVLAPFQAWLSVTTVALAYLLFVLLLATIWGRAPAVVASMLATGCLNFFFLRPIFTFTIADLQNWIALAAFLITALTAADLAERAKRRSAIAGVATAVSANNRSVFEATIDPLMTIDADGRIIDVNTAMERVSGRTRTQLVGSDFSACFIQPEQAWAGYRRTWHEGFVHDHPVELRHVDGHVTSGLCRESVYRDDKGTAIGVIAVIRPTHTSAGERPQSMSDPGMVRVLKCFTAFASIVPVGLGLLGIAGWLFGVPLLLTIIPGSVAIQPNAAVCLFVLGLSLWLMREPTAPVAKYRKLSGQVLAILVASVGLLSLMESLAGWDFGIDQLLFKEATAGMIAGLRPSLMSPVAALDLLLLGGALCTLDRKLSTGSHRFSPAQVCALLATVVSVVGLFDLILASAMLPYPHMALPTALGLILLSFGTVLVRTEDGLSALFVSASTGGTLVRRLLPASICIPVLIAALWWQFPVTKVFPGWLMILVMVAMLGGFTVMIGFLADRSDAARRNAEEALRHSEEELREAQRLARTGSWCWVPSADRTTWSEELYRIASVDPTALPVGHNEQARIYTHDSFQRLDAAVQETLRTGKGYELELEMATADGKRRAVTARGEAERDANGQLTVLRGTLHDMTERKQAEERLQHVNRAHHALSMTNQVLTRATDEATLLQQVCEAIVVRAGYRMCWIGFAQQDAPNAVRIAAQRGADEVYLEFANITWADTERGATGTCIRTGETQIARDIASDPRLLPWRADAMEHGYAANVAIPLMSEGKVFGALTIYSAEVTAFVDEEVKLLTDLGSDLAYGIVTLRLQTARRKAETDEAVHQREVAIGLKIQQMLLLDEPPEGIKGLHAAAISIPSQRIAGDFYQFFTHKGESVDVIIADVMGKGIPAALLGSAIKRQFTEAMCHLMASSPSGVLPEPRDIVTLADAEMTPRLIELESFVTLGYARLDLVRQHLTLVDCGHTGLVHLGDDGRQCEIIHGDNLPLGIRVGETYNQIDIPFEVGDIFVFCSDGVTQASNSAGEPFGVDRLADCISANAVLGPQALANAIRIAVAEFAGSDQLTDDLTCLVMQMGNHAEGPSYQEMVIQGDVRELRRAREFIRNFCTGLPGSWLDQDEVAGLELAVSEAASNVMKHVYREHHDECIHAEAEACADHVAVRLRYLGEAFDPSIAPPPSVDGSRDSGFGLYLITNSVDDVRYYCDDGGRNCIELIMNRKH